MLSRLLENVPDKSGVGSRTNAGQRVELETVFSVWSPLGQKPVEDQLLGDDEGPKTHDLAQVLSEVREIPRVQRNRESERGKRFLADLNRQCLICPALADGTFGCLLDDLIDCVAQGDHVGGGHRWTGAFHCTQPLFESVQ